MPDSHAFTKNWGDASVARFQRPMAATRLIFFPLRRPPCCAPAWTPRYLDTKRRVRRRLPQDSHLAIISETLGCCCFPYPEAPGALNGRPRPSMTHPEMFGGLKTGCLRALNSSGASGFPMGTWTSLTCTFMSANHPPGARSDLRQDALLRGGAFFRT